MNTYLQKPTPGALQNKHQPDAVAVDPSMHKPCHPAASQAFKDEEILGLLKFRKQIRIFAISSSTKV